MGVERKKRWLLHECWSKMIRVKLKKNPMWHNAMFVRVPWDMSMCAPKKAHARNKES